MILPVYLHSHARILKSVHEGGGDGGDNFVCPYLVILLFEFNNSPSSLDPRVIREIQHEERCH